MNNTKNKHFRKSLLMLDIKILIALLIAFGQYFKINSFKITSVFIRIYCVCVTLFSVYHAILSIGFDPSNVRLVTLNTLWVIEFLCWFCTSQITGRVYLSTYTQTILTCDSLMGYTKNVFAINNLYIVMIIAMCLGLFSLINNALFSLFWIDLYPRDITKWIFLLISHYIVTYSNNLAPFTLSWVVGMLHYRLMLLRQTLERNTVPVNIVGKDKIQPKLRLVRKCLINYNNLLDAFDGVDFHMQFTMIAVLVFNIPIAVLCGYVLLKETLLAKSRRLTSVYVNFIRITLAVVAPCTLTEMCYNEVDRLKAVLTMQLIQCSDAELCAELQRALDYVIQRPFNFTLLRAVRVDIQLIITIFALLVTYTILIIQFTHFTLD